eukprot:scaffold31990_cov95-Cyclotella_meneghiniana.AAC.2
MTNHHLQHQHLRLAPPSHHRHTQRWRSPSTTHLLTIPMFSSVDPGEEFWGNLTAEQEFLDPDAEDA